MKSLSGQLRYRILSSHVHRTFCARLPERQCDAAKRCPRHLEIDDDHCAPSAWRSQDPGARRVSTRVVASRPAGKVIEPSICQK